MNLVGKIFVVLIFIMSLVFMSIAVMVYATHRNWKDEIYRTEAKGNVPPGLKKQLEDKKAENATLTDIKGSLEKKLEIEESDHKRRLAELETEKGQKSIELVEMTNQRDELMAQARKLTEDLAITHQNLTNKTAEVNTLRGQIRTVQADSDKRASDVVVATEKNNQLTGDLSRLTERNLQLATQVTKATLLLAKHSETVETSLNDTPPPLDGIVLATSGTQNDLLEISLGSDDGIRVGHMIDVYREGKYLARAEIKKIDSNRAVASVDPKIHLGPIQKGDRVTTRIKV